MENRSVTKRHFAVTKRHSGDTMSVLVTLGDAISVTALSTGNQTDTKAGDTMTLNFSK
jgi:hypothetical protein